MFVSDDTMQGEVPKAASAKESAQKRSQETEELIKALRAYADADSVFARIKPPLSKNPKDRRFKIQNIDELLKVIKEPSVAALLSTGSYIFKDGYLIRLSAECLFWNRGTLCIKEEAKQHLEEYAVDVTAALKKKKWRILRSINALRSGKREIAYRKRIKPIDSGELSFRLQRSLEHKLSFGQGGPPPRSFCDSLVWYMQNRPGGKLTNEMLAENAGVSTKTVQRVRSGQYEPSLQLVVALCVGLHISPLSSVDLIDLAGYRLIRDNPLHGWYRTIIAISEDESVTIDICNELLIQNGYPPLVSIRQ